MKYTKIIKRETKILALIVVMLLVTVLGVSYAMFMKITDNSNNQIVTTGTLEIEYASSNGYLNGETYNELLPMSDEQGLLQAGYEFSVKNTGNLPVAYQVYLYINEESYNADVQANKISGDLFREIESIKYNVQTNENGNETVNKLSETANKEENNITKYIIYSGEIEQNNAIDTHKLRIWLDNDLAVENIGKYVYLKLEVASYVKGQEPEVPTNPICKRATDLHTETCSQTSNYCNGAGYTQGSTITYGNLGTRGTLTSGDAFDCDVNGNGIIDTDSEGNSTERFYYVSNYYNTTTKQFENNTATLIYYNNTSGGTANNTTLYAYNSDNTNYNGPVTAIQQLPTTSQWNNVSLKNTTRAILNEIGGNTTSGGTLPSSYSYEGYAARLLTYQEVVNACGSGTVTSTGYLDTCQYLMENTKFSSDSMGTYGYWLETPRPIRSYSVWDVYVGIRVVTSDNAYNKYNGGVRPAIEVSITDIEY